MKGKTRFSFGCWTADATIRVVRSSAGRTVSIDGSPGWFSPVRCRVRDGPPAPARHRRQNFRIRNSSGKLSFSETKRDSGTGISGQAGFFGQTLASLVNRLSSPMPKTAASIDRTQSSTASASARPAARRCCFSCRARRWRCSTRSRNARGCATAARRCCN